MFSPSSVEPPASRPCAAALVEAQTDCHRLLDACVNGGLFFAQAATRASSAYACWTSLVLPGDAKCGRQLVVPPYAGDNPFVRRLGEYLAPAVSSDLLAVIVHGSLATQEEIAYSDFDALVIVRDQTLRDPRRLARLSRRLSRARRFMFEFDPLQHHGWFVLTEADLSCHSEARFPMVLFPHCRSVLPLVEVSLRISPRNAGNELRQAFASVVRSFRATLTSGRYLRNRYDLKNLLSTFMLLPALYLQARDGRGVYKRDSFDLARPDFAPSEWQSMDDVSRMRMEWSCHLAGWRRWLMTAVHPWRRHVVRLVAPPLPARMRLALSDGLPDRMALLVRRMEEQLAL